MQITWHTPQDLGTQAPELLIGFTISTSCTDVAPCADAVSCTDAVLGQACAGNLDWLGTLTGVVPGLDDAQGDKDELLILHPQGGPVRRLALAGLGAVCAQHMACGEADGSWSGMLPQPGGLHDRLRGAAGVALSRARTLRAQRVALSLDALVELAARSGDDPLRLIHEAVYGALVGLYRYTAMKTDSKLPPDPRELILVAASPLPGAHETVAQAEAEAAAVCLARDLVNTPSNHLVPADFVVAARSAAAGLPLTCTVLGRGQLEAAGMGAFMAVARGSAHDPALVCLEYAPLGHEEDKPLILIGKGLTFDSGGISLKPAAGMQDMKSDMAGAAAVLAAMTILARTGGSRRVIGLMPCAENMPDALATRPGDVVTTLNGKTVEIINTDAEGRLVLCDTLTYAQKRWQPEAIVDVATLTGACIVALGPDVAGVFGTDDVLVERITRLGAVRGEWFWRMPVWECYLDTLKSQTADLANAGSREGGASSAAVFLRQFVSDAIHWAHLDIAGPSYMGSKTPGRPAGGTGVAVRTLAALGR